ncbi:hypothetical protein HYS28_02305 [Candidatus Uhrbacteria bacterium]|nr:hypothetical protein [Candidatus Uhrbacteria bacterium]
MLALALTITFLSSLAAVAIGVGVLLFVRRRTEAQARARRPAGFWVRAAVLGVDVTIVQLVTLFFAFRGHADMSSAIVFVATAAYFFFSWFFFATTPAGAVARLRIQSDAKARPLQQVVVRLLVSAAAFVGWLPMLWDREKRALHDIAARTKVVYSADVPTARAARPEHWALAGIAFAALCSLVGFADGTPLASIAADPAAAVYDLDADGLDDVVVLDAADDGRLDALFYDVDNDGVIDVAMYDVDGDGQAESVDREHDGRVDGFDFDNDNVLDVTLRGGNPRTAWYAWFVVLALGGIGTLVFGLSRERRRP